MKTGWVVIVLFFILLNLGGAIFLLPRPDRKNQWSSSFKGAYHLTDYDSRVLPESIICHVTGSVGNLHHVVCPVIKFTGEHDIWLTVHELKMDPLVLYRGTFKDGPSDYYIEFDIETTGGLK